MGKLLPLILIILGIGGGAGAGFMLKPAPEVAALANPCGDMPAATEPTEPAAPLPPEDRDYVKMNNQFIVPVVEEGRVASLVVLSLSVEVQTGTREMVFAREPKLRDIFLQQLFDHANQGGFRGAFTNSNTLDVLRNSLREAGVHVLGDSLLDVLITDIARQDA
ncbi:flagellar basal body-associated protein FliL [Primorskyibacter flagellatus]|uniref:Flagellar basal body-associated protein FliL n=1 Tax=Primorskyibacter flagellatus TaxID=1387277 RepID=A0A917AFN5_9RHOB|nr:flagellar basal body-associated protein FliL [Primorskyibacter flagellatus]GGE47390.1 flagellar basal body-associated protein FliL [Primorskyibacter flagellatus]